MYNLVIFDMDGLMFDTETLYYQANKKTADKLGIPFDYSFYEKHVGASESDFFEAMYEAFSKEKVDKFVIESRKDLRNLLFSTVPDIKTGLRPLLDYLRENNYKTAVASSSERKIVEALLTNADILSYFDVIVGGDEVERSKPDPEIFKKAAAKAGENNSKVLVLEDSLNGVRAAHAAGYDVIMVPDLIQPSNEAKEKTIAVCKDLNDVFFKIKK